MNGFRNNVKDWGKGILVCLALYTAIFMMIMLDLKISTVL